MVIEHRSAEGVIGAYENSGMVKCAIWQGTTPVMVYDEKHPDFEEENKQIAVDLLTDWLQFIQDGGTTAIYTLRVYPDEAKNITNKTAYRAATRFQLNQAQGANYKETPDGRVMVIRDQQRSVGNTNAGNNSQLQQLIDSNKQMMEIVVKSLQQQQDTKLDKLIGFLEQQNQVPKEGIEDKFLKLGELLIDKPEIIDRVGYIFRPDIYTRYQEPVQQPINGTEKTEPPKTEPEMAEQPQEPEVLTPEEEAALTERMNKAIDTLETSMGLDVLTEALEKFAAKDPKKLQSLLTWL